MPRPTSKPAQKNAAASKRTTSAADPLALYRRRLQRLSDLIDQAGADHLLVTSEKDVAYLTGFLGGHSYTLVPRGTARPVIISDFRYQEELEPTRRIADVHIRRGGMAQAIAEVIQARESSRCGIQAEHMPLAEFNDLQERAAGLQFVPTTGLVASLRARKDEHEIELIRRAIRIQEKALLLILKDIGPGDRELGIAAELEAEMKLGGSTEPGFQTIIAAGANGSLPHYRPRQAKIAANKPLLIDWGAVYQGYHGDMTRTFTLGKWPAKILEIYQIVHDAQQLAAAALAPGKTTHEVDAVAREYITRHGYGEHFGHGLGHGMGLDGHEDPRLNPMFPPVVLEPGHVVTIEPGIYLPGLGGVRIEDDYVVTETGAENLCTLPKDLKWATLQ
jgi:Xaa-Pro aminopeptidase